MNVLFVNTSEKTGGAAIAAGRIAAALGKQGVNVSRCFRRGKAGFYIERAAIWAANGFSRDNLFAVDIANCGEDITKLPEFKEADIVHLHWINQGFISINGLKKIFDSGKPVVWTMHDMWPCTGICHHSWGCERFTSICGCCRFLNSSCRYDLSYHIFKKKKKLFENTDSIHLVAVSSWLKSMADKSGITSSVNSTVIPNAIDVSEFSPKGRIGSREILSLPQDAVVILVGAARLDDPIKGIDLLKKSLSVLKEKRKVDNLCLVLFGKVKNESFFKDFPIPYFWKGVVSDQDYASVLYSAADVTVVPSLYETFGQTITESMACGCPVVSFNNSGQKDIISHLSDGYLAEYGDVNDFADGILWALDIKEKHLMAQKCREKVCSLFSSGIVAAKYMTLYNDLLNRND